MTVLLIMGHATDALQFENALRLQLPYCTFVVGILLFLFDFVHPQVHLGHDRVIQYFVDEAIGHRQRVFLSVGVTNLPRISINLSRLQSSRLQCFCLLHKVQIMAEHRRDLLEVWMGTKLEGIKSILFFEIMFVRKGKKRSSLQLASNTVTRLRKQTKTCLVIEE